jgi:predicted transcriptional regulator
MSKRQYRNRIEITANILEIAKEGSRKTRIMYLGNLSFDLVQKYLGQLQQLGLIEAKRNDTGERIYTITPRGKRFLSDYHDLQKHSEIATTKKQILENALVAQK